MPEILVVNASPLIFLGNARRIDLLRATGANRFVVPEPVARAVVSGGHVDAAAKALSAAGWPERRKVSEIPATVVQWDLGPGESSIIATTTELPGAHAVMDDLSGRKCGRALDIPIIGTRGVITTRAHFIDYHGDDRRRLRAC